MNEKEILENIEFAKNLVKDQPEPFKTESFKIILNKLLDPDILTGKSPSPKKRTPKKSQDKDSSEELIIADNTDEKMSELANEIEVDVEQLKDVISINGNKLEIISSINDPSSKQKMIKGSLCILLLFEKFYNSQWIKSTIIAEQLREIGIRDPGNNLSTYLKNESELFRFRGAGSNHEYKLTTTIGRKKALDTLKGLAAPA